MFGTIAKMKFKPGMMQKFLEDMKDDMGNPDAGSVALYAFDSVKEPDTAFMVVVFQSEEAYRKNADNPQTNERFTKMMNYLASEPEWNDGNILFSQTNQ